MKITTKLYHSIGHDNIILLAMPDKEVRYSPAISRCGEGDRSVFICDNRNTNIKKSSVRSGLIRKEIVDKLQNA